MATGVDMMCINCEAVTFVCARVLCTKFPTQGWRQNTKATSTQEHIYPLPSCSSFCSPTRCPRSFWPACWLHASGYRPHGRGSDVLWTHLLHSLSLPSRPRESLSRSISSNWTVESICSWTAWHSTSNGSAPFRPIPFRPIPFRPIPSPNPNP